MEPRPEDRRGPVDLLTTAEPRPVRRGWLWLLPVVAVIGAAVVHGSRNDPRPQPAPSPTVVATPPITPAELAARRLPVDIELRQSVQEPARRTLQVTLVVFNLVNRPVVVRGLGASSAVTRLETVRVGSGASRRPRPFVVRPASAVSVTLQFRVLDCASRARAVRLPVRVTTFDSGAVTADVNDLLGPNGGRSLLSSLCPTGPSVTAAAG
ncbi:MAG TPA: hypothetical protein VFT62_06245 [Mycobacteriales bacterium]|nr:hypothetical protein [Mycobacteriales bacterium]